MNYFDLFVKMLRDGANMEETDAVVSAMKEEILKLDIDPNCFVRLIGRKSSVEVFDYVITIAATLQSFGCNEKLPELMIAISAYMRRDPSLLDALFAPQVYESEIPQDWHGIKDEEPAAPKTRKPRKVKSEPPVVE